MNVPSYAFLGFAVLVAALINISSTVWWRRTVLLVANLAFLFSFVHSPAQLAPFAGLLVLGFAGMKLMERYKRRALFAIFVAAVLLAFCWLKQYAFVPHQTFLPFVYTTIGMSYVFFRILHLIIDAYEDALPRRVDVVSYVNYTLNFTCLIAGPIQFYGDYYRTESQSPLPLNWSSAAIGANRIITGFFKVAVVAPLVWYANDRSIHALTPGIGVTEHVAFGTLIIALFPLYLYFNFSGYTDFVIGVARFLRLELPENFNKPLTAVGPIDFWSRWHMTLSNWLKTYVYSPLLLNLIRRYPSRAIEPYLGVFAYFVTFFLVGVWHGQTTMFLFFGFLQGLGVASNKLYQILMTRRLGRPKYVALCANPFYAGVTRGLTYTWFAGTMLWFWSTWSQLAGFATIEGISGIILSFAFLAVVATLAIAACMAVSRNVTAITLAGQTLLATSYVKVAWYTALAAITISLTVMLNAPAPHIVYRAF